MRGARPTPRTGAACVAKQRDRYARQRRELVLISALSGYQLFGFFGVVYGPVLMSVMLTALEVYEQFYASEAPAATNAPAAPPLRCAARGAMPVST